MAKRFIDTEMFNDEWFCDLSKDCKLFFVYYITTCDHAGVLRLNKKLCEFQTGLRSIETVIKELGNCLVTVKDGVYFMPKFIEFQYPNFPQSNVKQQFGAISILKQLGFWDNELNTYLTVSKELSKTYVNVNDTVYNNKDEKKYFRQFKHLKISLEENSKLLEFGYTQNQIDEIYDSIENYKKNTAYSSLYLTALKWLKKEYPEIKKEYLKQTKYTEDEIRKAKNYWIMDRILPDYFDKNDLHLLQ